MECKNAVFEPKSRKELSLDSFYESDIGIEANLHFT